MIWPRYEVLVPTDTIPTDPAALNWSIQPQIIAITVSLTICALVTVLCRVYVRIFVLRQFGLNDYFIVAAMILGLIGLAFLLKSVSLGLGRHYYAVQLQDLYPLLRAMYLHGILIPFAICSVKLSIVFFLLRLAEGTRYTHILWALVGFLVVFALITVCSLIFVCVPIQAIWELRLQPPPQGVGTAKCMSWNMIRKLGLFNSITNICTDFVLAILPVQLIWNLHLNKRTRISLIIVLGLGLFACGAAIIRTTVQVNFFRNEHDPDITGPRAWYFVWQFTEMNVGIIAATLPTLRPAFRWLLETAKSFTSGASHSYSRRGNRHSYSPGYVAQNDGSFAQLGQLHHRDGEGSAKHTRNIGTEAAEGETAVGVSRPWGNESSDGILAMGDVKPEGGIVKTTVVTWRSG